MNANIQRMMNLLSPAIRCVYVGLDSYRGRRAVLCDKIQNADIAVYYDSETKIYVVWNALVHKYTLAEHKTHDFALKKGFFLRKNYDNFIAMKSIYRKMQPRNEELTSKEQYEKIVLIKEKYIEQFCESPFDYLLPNPNDDGFREYTLFATPFSQEVMTFESSTYRALYQDVERKRRTCTVLERDASFRKKVFAKYPKPHCVICGIDCDEILEAAHIVAVSDGGTDDAENGVCLCRNHHRLFDNKRFFIDLATETIHTNNPQYDSYMALDKNCGELL